MSDKKESPGAVCSRRNSAGECIEWNKAGDVWIGTFREEDKKCHPEFYEEFKKSFAKGKFGVVGTKDSE